LVFRIEPSKGGEQWLPVGLCPEAGAIELGKRSSQGSVHGASLRASSEMVGKRQSQVQVVGFVMALCR
jgi:hypothetical protein